MSKEIYNGNTIPPKGDGGQKKNRSTKPRRRSPLFIIVMLVSLSLVIVGYIWNKICVNKLVVKVNDLNNECARVESENEFLSAEINKKSSLERIEKKIADDRLDLISPREQPIWFEINDSKLEAVNGEMEPGR